MSEPFTFGFNAVALKSACREVAADRPDYVYEPKPWILEDGTDGSTMCRYTEQDGTPGCIIGQGVFYITGETVDECAMGGGCGHQRWSDALGVDWNRLDDNYRAWQWLCTVQGHQDMKHSWSDAIKYADEGYDPDQAREPEEEDKDEMASEEA